MAYILGAVSLLCAYLTAAALLEPTRHLAVVFGIAAWETGKAALKRYRMAKVSRVV